MSHPGMNNPARPFWQNLFPYEYWGNRIAKVNQFNPHDKLEPVVLASKLADLYTHIFVAKVRNPYQPWFMLKEATRGQHIKQTLDELTVQDGDLELILVEELIEEPDSLMSYNLIEKDWDVDLRDMIAADFLGCPAELNREKKTFDFHEDPGLHYASTNAILNYSQENLELLNDFKHGFRVLPFDESDLDFIEELEQLENPSSIKELREQIVADDRHWSLYFLSMSTKKAEETDSYDYEASLEIYSANLDACLTFAELCLYKLHNLFGNGGRHKVSPYLEGIHHQTELEGEDYTVIEKLGELKMAFDPGFTEDESNKS